MFCPDMLLLFVRSFFVVQIIDPKSKLHQYRCCVCVYVKMSSSLYCIVVMIVIKILQFSGFPSEPNNKKTKLKMILMLMMMGRKKFFVLFVISRIDDYNNDNEQQQQKGWFFRYGRKSLIKKIVVFFKF